MPDRAPATILGHRYTRLADGKLAVHTPDGDVYLIPLDRVVASLRVDPR